MCCKTIAGDGNGMAGDDLNKIASANRNLIYFTSRLLKYVLPHVELKNGEGSLDPFEALWKLAIVQAGMGPVCGINFHATKASSGQRNYRV